ncbi:MAG: ubiquinone-binding protein [Candidatus Pelagibacter sp.]|nr:ubiquinone-binding protein [Candidatus Pelagibacter sp.]OUW11662.1 MAG: ubiquinone-binding protein [Candidatus Pelagibacter sp. TMED166]|tara:strand:- start:20136 stop:20588 length:453 start_codon:yes stop_codon:yes gene_type:complete
MSSASVIKLINCSKNNLIEMVLDIEKYPSFVPWCISSKVYERKNLEDRLEIKADMTVGKKILNQTYLSNVIYFKKKNYILVTSIKGPLKYLKNEWFFEERGRQKTQVEFRIDFELNNKFLNSIMEKSFNLGLIKIANSFEKRANSLFDKV